MKTCPVCALDLQDTYLFCPDDGSSLAAAPNGSTESKPANAFEPDDETAGAVVLYCPACAAEYPLTFSTCPVHAVQLTRRRIPRSPTKASDLRRHDAPIRAQALAGGLELQRGQSKIASRLTTLDLKRPEGPDGAAAIVNSSDDHELEHDPVAAAPLNSLEAVLPAVTNFSSDAREQGFERPGFRVAAIATVIALAVFGLLVVYSFVSNFSRRSHSSDVQIASKAQASPQPLLFVPTPQEAQDYKEEAPVPSASTPPERQPDRARSEGPSSSPTEPAVRNTPVAQPLPKVPVATAPPAAAPVSTAKVSNPPMPALPSGASGGFDARLIRVRSRKTPAGFRYDLTFNMQEQAGRSAQWQRVLISTRSASGISHSEAIPFSHRLGAAGALTFTISVELTGRSETDWQGRIVCTTLGWDNKGAPLQASFGANVTP